jgi:surfeit locus 1 family protein
MILRRIFSRRWILTTLLVIAAMGVLARLGIWQLDRLEKRRAFNARVEAQLSQPELVIEAQAIEADSFVQQLAGMEYRSARVLGEFDHSHQIALRSQYYDNQYGVALITPLHIAGSQQVILVNRGWIPIRDWEDGLLAQYDQPGLVEVTGMLRPSMDKADFGSRSDPTPAPGQKPLTAWNFVNIPAISVQMPYALLPAYIQQAPGVSSTRPPYPSLPELEITEGPHLSYAIQWFTFAAILGMGYPFFIRKQEKNETNPARARPDQETEKQGIQSSVKS